MKSLKTFGLLVLRAYANVLILVYDETVAFFDKKGWLSSNTRKEVGLERMQLDILQNASEQFLPKMMITFLAGMGLALFYTFVLKPTALLIWQWVQWVTSPL